MPCRVRWPQYIAMRRPFFYSPYSPSSPSVIPAHTSLHTPPPRSATARPACS